MANRKKRLAREQAQFIENLKIKSKLRSQKQEAEKGFIGFFEQMKAVKFRWDLMPKNSAKKFNANYQPGAYLLKEFYAARKYRSAQRRLEQILRHPKLTEVSLGFAAGLVYFLKIYHEFVHPLEDWKPPKSNKEAVLFESLFLHLFVRYPLPKSVVRAIAPVYFVQPSNPFFDVIAGLVHGQGVHKIKLDSVKLNGKMNFIFQNAPDRFSLFEAIWWGRIRGLGASEKVAYLIIGQMEPQQWVHWQDWLDDFIFFTKKLNLTDSKLLKEIFQFTMYQNGYRSYIVKIEDNHIDVPVIYPNYSLKGRSLASVERHLEEWKKQIELVKTFKDLGEFPEPPFKDFEHETKNHRYLIRRLKNYKELSEEGRKMKHCVASYASNCLSKESSIWSFRQITGKGSFRRLATVEISFSEDKYELEEFQGKCNQKPPDFVIRVVKDWAKQEGIEAEDWSY